MNFGKLSLLNPGDLLAEVPGTLGFYPSDSIVFIGLSTLDSSVSVGPVIRGDIADIDSIDEVAEHINLLDIDFTVAVVVCEDAAAVPDLALSDVLNVATFHVPALETGAPFEAVWMHPDAPLGLRIAWERGCVSEVSKARSTRELLAGGRIIAIDREERFEPFRHNRDICPRDILNKAEGVYANLLAKLGRAGHRAEQLDAYRTVITELRDVIGGEDIGRAMALTMVCCDPNHVLLRDALTGDVMDKPDTYRDTLLTVARACYNPGIRANSLALVALISDSTNAAASLHVAHETDPDNSLVNLCIQLSHLGPLSDVNFAEAFEIVRHQLALSPAT